MKQREPRTQVLLRARMRAEGRRNDVCIRNVSSNGMLLQCASPPPRGTFVDVTCGHQAIVARVIWASEHRFGVKARSRINVDELVHGAMARAQPAQRKSDAGFAAVARSAGPAATLDRNRQVSAALPICPSRRERHGSGHSRRLAHLRYAEVAGRRAVGAGLSGLSGLR